MILEHIQSPADVKKLSLEELKNLATEARKALFTKLYKYGGHCGPNFGFVEATIALHYVFTTPEDKIVYDVSHQSYIHKMLTGRAAAFLDEHKYDDVTGYTNPDESQHDFFNIGHTSTAVSLALGLATARDLQGQSGNVVAIIGDGSLSGGEAFEALSNAGEYAKNFIIVVNDNEMSIAENHGGLYEGLRLLRHTQGEGTHNFFRSLNLDYIYVEQGNDLATLIQTFQNVKDHPRPIVVHLHTDKGHGFDRAEQNKEEWHYTAPFDPETGEKAQLPFETYGEVTYQILSDIFKEDPKAVAITAGVPSLGGFTAERRKAAGRQFIDVGIAEEHGVALASGLAKGGAHPIFMTASTFMQRTYDQIAQDLCINRNPAVLLSLFAGYEGMNDITHLCFFDIAMMGSIPGLTVLEPTCKEEYEAMLRWAMAQEQQPVALRTAFVATSRPGTYDTTYATPRYSLDKQGQQVAIIALGSFYSLGQQTSDMLQAQGIDATLINPRFASAVDVEMLERLKADHQLVITLENGVLDGGFGERIARFYGDSTMKVRNYGLPKMLIDRYDRTAFAQENRLTPALITEDIVNILG